MIPINLWVAFFIISNHVPDYNISNNKYCSKATAIFVIRVKNFIYLYKLIDKGHITDYKKQVGKRLTRVYYHIEPSGQNRLEELTQEYLKTTQSIQNILNFDFKTQQLEDA